MKTRVIILPMDGFGIARNLLENLHTIMSGPGIEDLIAMVKLNDALHFPGVGSEIVSKVKDVLPRSIGIFLDLKIADVSETNKNTLKRYVEYEPRVVTVTSTVSAKSLMAIKETLPKTSIALVDTLTDVSQAEVYERYGVMPADKISCALLHFEKYLKDDNPIEMVVCGPTDLPALRERFGDRYQFITPGIRSRHMAKDHQERITSAHDALMFGASFLVMGAQMTKGNPDAGISAEESRRITLEEISRATAEK